MNRDYQKFIARKGTPLNTLLETLNELAEEAAGVLFIVDETGRLLGSLTDGDIRRGLIRGLETSDPVEIFMNDSPKFIRECGYTIDEISALRQHDYKVIPILDGDDRIVDILNFKFNRTYLPVDAVLMAGGRGKRLKPMTDEVPKPMLKVGDKPILEHNINRLVKFGVDDIWLTVRYLSDQIEDYFGTGRNNGVEISYFREKKPMGTAGALSLMEGFRHDHLLVMNSDLLTTIDYEAFYRYFLEMSADLAIAAKPYSVEVPYAVLETSDDRVVSLKEKPTYTYYSNAGIYLMKRGVLDHIPKDNFYDLTDLIEVLLEKDLKVVTYSFSDYWLDIGKPEDFEKAQTDIQKIDL